MNKAVVYCSQTGFTEKYATWLAEDLGCRAVAYAGRSSVDVEALDVLVFCSWFHAATIKGATWVKQVMARHPAMHVIVLATGATPPPASGWSSEGEIEQAFRRTFPKAEYPNLPHFYCHGGFDLDRLGVADRVAMRLFFRMLGKSAQGDQKAGEMLDIMRKGFDGTSREYLRPVLEHIADLESAEGAAGEPGAESAASAVSEPGAAGRARGSCEPGRAGKASEVRKTC
ncbi:MULTISPECIES: flavodoxin domain-containing protein [unclassified Adlercreutzia]|uniref:flavodoxin domain-containing protein n=1 Tax=unclassified Adlercreutzia TaxID=2636013 RepID=UPI0013EBC8D0|nr:MULTISPECIES: flavodoxin domain-containing protein [unclassified Adlercreutzia]